MAYDDDADERLAQQAEELMRQHRFGDAAARYQDLRRRSPADLWALLGHVSALECAGAVEDATSTLEDAAPAHAGSAALHRFRHLFYVRREDHRRAAASRDAMRRGTLDDGDQLADLYFNQGRYREALSELRRLEADASAGGRAILLARIGACLRQTGDPTAGREHLRRALALDGELPWALSELAECERAVGDADAAREHYRAALALNPGDHWTRGHLAQVEHELGDTAAAVALYEEILAAEPKAAWARVELAQVLTESDPARAERLCREAVDTDPSFPWAHAHLGQLARRAGRHEAALTHYRQASAAQPNAVWILHELADTCRHLDRIQEGHAHLERARALAPYDATTYGYMASLLRHENRQEAARAHLQRAVDLDPEYAWAWRELSELRALSGDHDGAEAAYRRAGEIEPGEAVNDGLKAFLLRVRGTRDDALPWLERAVATAPGYLWAWRELIDLHLAADRPDRAEGVARRALERAPGNAPLLAALGESLRRQGRRDDAARAVDESLQAAPDQPQPWALRAELHAEAGDLDAALRCAEAALERDQGAEYRTLRAQVLAAMNRIDAAAAALEPVLAQKRPPGAALELAAAIAERRGDGDAAVALCERGLTDGRGDPRLAVRRARLALARGEESPTARLDALLAQPPAQPAPWREIAILLVQAGRRLDARRAALRLVEHGGGTDAERARAWLCLAEVELALDDDAASQRAVDEALSLDAELAGAHVLSAALAERAEDPAAAAPHLDALRSATDAEAVRQGALIAERAGDLDRAEALWTALAALPGDPGAHTCELHAFRHRHDRGDEAATASALAATDAAHSAAQRLRRDAALAALRRSGPAAALTVLDGPGLDAANRLLAAQLRLLAGEPAAASADARAAAEAGADPRLCRLVEVRARLAAHDAAGAETQARALATAAPDDEEAAVLLAQCLVSRGRLADGLAVLDGARLAERAGPERTLLSLLLALELEDEPTALLRLGRGTTPQEPQPLVRLIAAAWPAAWRAAPPAAPQPTDVESVPPFPSLVRRLAAGLTRHGRREAAAALLVSAAGNARGGDQETARALAGDAVVALRRAGHLGSAFTLARRTGWRALWRWVRGA